MNPIQQVLHDFHHLTGLSIQYLNTEQTSVYYKNFHTPLPKEVQELPYEKARYLVAPDKKGHFYVAGPYQINCSPRELTYKPATCTPYLKELLATMIRRSHQVKEEQHPLIAKALAYLEKNYGEPIGLTDVSDALSLNPCYFCSLFKTHTGASFNQYLTDLRIEKAKTLLVDTDLPIIDIAMSVGYNNQSYFSLIFKRQVGATPTVYRRKAQSLDVGYEKTTL